MIKITYLTPTYNRAHLLGNLYNSLLKQTNKDFCWLIVDDGSKDNTKELVAQWIVENKIQIEYVYKENGGKNTALDFAHSNCKTEFICCIDSDDYLSEDCTEILYGKFEKCVSDEIVGIVGRRAHYDGKPFNEKWCEKDQILYFQDLANVYGYSQDTILVFKTDIVKNFQFPKIPDERFITESVLYNQFFYDYKFLAMEECVYLAEYQENGYTSMGKDLFFKNPKGYLYALKQNAYYSYKNAKSFRKKFGYFAYYYAWKSALKIKDNFKDDYKIKFPFNFIGWVLQFKILPGLKRDYKDFLERKKDKNGN